MIAVSTHGRQFGGLVQYLLHGRSGEEHDRVAWVTAFNLPIDDPTLAAPAMQATAAQNYRVDQPVYHLVLSFDPGDQPTEATMREVASRLLRDLQLAEYQTLIVAHRDRWHSHMHLVINRVHPETGRAWNRWQDYAVIQRSLREQERALNLREVEGRLHQLPGQEPPTRRQTDPRRHERTVPGEPLAPGRRATIAETVAAVRELAIAHHIRDRGSRAEQFAIVDGARLAQLARLQRDAVLAGNEFDRALARVYADPAHARHEFDALTRVRGSEFAARAMTDRPEQFGALRTVHRQRALGLILRRDDTVARRNVPHAAELGLRAATAAERLRDDLVKAAAGPHLSNGDGRDAYAREVAHLSERIAAAEREVARTHAARLRLPSDRDLERVALLALKYLAPREVYELARWITTPQLMLAERLRNIGREILLGRERDVA